MPTNPKCIFCRIAAGEIPSEKLYEDEQLFVIKDIAPQAPVHLLVIPKAHISSLSDTTVAHATVLSSLLAQARESAVAAGLDQGYRIVINNGPHARQEVPHLHIHVLGGGMLPDMTPHQ